MSGPVLVVDNASPAVPAVCEAGPQAFFMTGPNLGEGPVAVFWKCERCGRMSPPAYGVARDLHEVAALAKDQWDWSGECEVVLG